MHNPFGIPPCHRWQLLDWLHKPQANRWLVASQHTFQDSRAHARVLFCNIFALSALSTVPFPRFM